MKRRKCLRMMNQTKMKMKTKFFLLLLAVGFMSHAQETVKFNYGHVITASGDTLSHEAFGDLCKQHSTSAYYHYTQAQAFRVHSEMRMVDKPEFRAGVTMVGLGIVSAASGMLAANREDSDEFDGFGRFIFGIWSIEFGTIFVVMSTELGDWLAEHIDYPAHMRKAVKFYNRDIQRIRK